MAAPTGRAVGCIPKPTICVHHYIKCKTACVIYPPLFRLQGGCTAESSTVYRCSKRIKDYSYLFVWSRNLTCKFRSLTLTWTQHSQRACSLVLCRVKLQHVDLLWVTSCCFTHRAAGADEETVSSCYVKCVICNVCYSLKNKYVMSETVWGSCLSSRMRCAVGVG